MLTTSRHREISNLLAATARHVDWDRLETAMKFSTNALSMKDFTEALANIGKLQLKFPEQLARLPKPPKPSNTWVLNEPNWGDASTALRTSDANLPALTCGDAWLSITTIGRPLSDLRMLLRTCVLRDLRNYISYGLGQDFWGKQKSTDPEKARFAKLLQAFQDNVKTDSSELSPLFERRAVCEEIDAETNMRVTGNWEQFVYFIAFIAEKKGKPELTWKAMQDRPATNTYHYGIRALNFWEATRTVEYFEALPSYKVKSDIVLPDTTYSRRRNSKYDLFARAQAEINSMLFIMNQLKMNRIDLMNMPYNEYSILMKRYEFQRSIANNRAETAWNKGAYI